MMCMVDFRKISIELRSILAVVSKSNFRLHAHELRRIDKTGYHRQMCKVQLRNTLAKDEVEKAMVHVNLRCDEV